jgi:hypothetical protein
MPATPLVTRKDARPPRSQAVVVRGGVMLDNDLLKAVEKCQAFYGLSGISVYCADELDLKDTLRELATPPAHATLSISTVLLLGGYTLLPTGGEHHYILVVPPMHFSALRELFTQVPNPLAVGAP